jgi:hypothetical protein
MPWKNDPPLRNSLQSCRNCLLWRPRRTNGERIVAVVGDCEVCEAAPGPIAWSERDYWCVSWTAMKEGGGE